MSQIRFEMKLFFVRPSILIIAPGHLCFCGRAGATVGATTLFVSVEAEVGTLDDTA